MLADLVLDILMNGIVVFVEEILTAGSLYNANNLSDIGIYPA